MRSNDIRCIPDHIDSKGSNLQQSGAVNLPGGGSLGPDGVQEGRPKGISVTPEPGFVIKTKDETGHKVFINVCQCAKIGKPAPRNRLDENGNEMECMNVPVSLGPPRATNDKAGNESTVYDVLVNPEVLAEASGDKTGVYRDFLCQLALSHVMQKYKCTLDERYKLPKIKYMGELANQMVRDTSADPQIQELSSSSDGPAKQKAAPAQAKAEPPAAPPAPLVPVSYRLWGVWNAQGDGTDEQRIDLLSLSIDDTVVQPADSWPARLELVLDGLLPGSCSQTGLAGVQVQCSAYECCIKVPRHERLSLLLPYAIEEGACASCNAHEERLSIVMTVDRTPIDQGPDAGSKVWMLALALDDGKRTDSGRKQNQAAAANGEDDPDALPEDKFHLKLPKGANKYTGEAEEDSAGIPGESNGPITEDDVLPEYKFHQKDIVSQHLIETRERERLAKIAKAEEEREERLKNNDPNVEYVDFDALRREASGKAKLVAERKNAALDEAAVEEGTGSDAVFSQAPNVLLESVQGSSSGVELSSNLWAELL
ncbi:unnamed protein product [Chrysoparadoxa australica]